MPKYSRSEYLAKLKKAKAAADDLTKKQLDKIIGHESKKRLLAYEHADWFRARMSFKEMGVWRRAGGLPESWTRGSLKETARKVKIGLAKNSPLICARSKRALPRIMEFADIISREKTLYPIVFLGDTGTRGRRRGCIKTKGDIDDGCMRAIALVLRGAKNLNVYFGVPNKN